MCKVGTVTEEQCSKIWKRSIKSVPKELTREDIDKLIPRDIMETPDIMCEQGDLNYSFYMSDITGSEKK